MSINFQSALGIHEQALQLRAKRAAVIANNLANTNTPNFKARDIDFRATLSKQAGVGNSTKSVGLGISHDRHIQTNNSAGFMDELFRTPQQPSIDGNTVEEQVEHAEYMKNSLAFQASFEMLNSLSLKVLCKSVINKTFQGTLK